MSLVTSFQKRSTPYFLNFIYSGQMFSIYNNYTVPFYEYRYFILKTPANGRLVHLLSRDYTIKGGYLINKIYEGTIYSGGTPKLSYNLERRSSKVSDTLFYTSPTISSNGTVIDQFFFGSDTYNDYVYSYSTGLSEIVLKKNTNYLFEFYNPTGSDVTISNTLVFYESGN